MKEIWADANKNNKILHFKNFQKPEITWEDVLKFIYDLSKIENEDIGRYYRPGENNIMFGSVLIKSGYFIFDESNLFSTFKGVRELMEKVNGGNSGEECAHYTRINSQRGCNCFEQWHIQTLRFSISDYSVGNHNDPNNVLYWQLLGTSYWIMNDKEEYKLEPGDLLYFNKEDTHSVLQDGPRAGIIIDDMWSKQDR